MGLYTQITHSQIEPNSEERLLQNNKTRVAVLISTFNGEKYIEAQLDSIFAQTGNNDVSVIVRDDGSTDNTVKIVKEFAKIHPVVILDDGENVRPAKSFVKLLLQSDNFDYYAFCDQDDIWDSDKIETAINALRNIKGPAIYHSNARLVDSSLNYLNRNTYRNIPHTDIYSIFGACNVQGCTVVFNDNLARIIKTRGMPNVITMHDAFLARVCVSLGGTIVYDDIPHMSYRQHAGNVMGIKVRAVDKIKNRLNEITKPAEISICDQAKEIQIRYGDLISPANTLWLEQVSKYKDNVFNRTRLAFSRNTKYISLNESVTYRLKILLGNK